MNNTKRINISSRILSVLAKAAAFAFVLFYFAVYAGAQTAMITKNLVLYKPTNTITAETHCQLSPSDVFSTSTAAYDKSYVTSPIYPVNSSDPWVNSALIEYSQIASGTRGTTSNYTYPNNCLALCAEVTCSNPTRMIEGSTGTSSGAATIYPVRSGSFPIQQVLFEIFKYQQNSNPYNPDSTPPIRTIALYPTDGNNICYGVEVYDDKKFSDNDEDNDEDMTVDPTGATSCCNKIDCSGSATIPPLCEDTVDNFCAAAGNDSVKAKANCEAGLTVLHFCAAWDGMYEIDGEFGQSNGDFGYRTTISSNWPGDGVTTPDIDLSQTIVYPGENQIPIQVDVTNIHSVRSTPTLVGQKRAVTAQPYNINYRISKDATVTINIYDPSELRQGGTSTQVNPDAILRHLVNNLPREGEGFQGGGVGSSEDTITTMMEAWDGRDDSGRLLPFGNYIVDLHAFTIDEWDIPPQQKGDQEGDISRSVTRQLSLDPLKITDIEAKGLTKTNTAYAMLNYILTEDATVHFEVYTPGTTFDNLNIVKNAAGATACSNGYCSNTNTALVPQNGYKVFSLTEQKAGRTKINSKWDGMCWSDANTCANAVQTVLTGSYVTGADASGITGDNAGVALPDGDYVYLIWAEIPYSGDTIVVNDFEWNGVKTAVIENGILGINRGLPELTVGSVGYSTIGSSPVAHGLDPFIFSYALSRDAYVTAQVLTTSYDAGDNKSVGPYVVKTLLDNEIQTAASGGNNLSWDGIDDNGRYVTQGDYLFRVIARDSMYPTKVVTSTVEFPVDLFRVVDVRTTSLLEEATSQATISYILSKSMHVTLNIYDKDVVIPNDIAANNWEPQVCQPGTNITSGQVQCIYRKGSDGSIIIDPTIEPIKSFTGAREGEALVTEYWDGYYEEDNTATGGSGTTQAMYPDGFYPYYIYARADVAGSKYYSTKTVGGSEVLVPQDPKTDENSGFLSSINATDQPTGYITIARGPVYFTNIQITPSSPKLVYSSETIQIPTYEVEFSLTRTASVQIQIVSLSNGACTGINGSNKGAICRVLTKNTMTNLSTVYDGNVPNKLYWDGKDEQGNYVKSDAYQVRFIAEPYPKANGVSQTIESRVINVDNFQIFDRYTTDVTRDNGSVGTFAYQVSVPMKVAIQIFKPGTMTSGAADGTLIDPADPTGPTIGENSIDKVLVKAIIGVSPHLIPIERVWDGTDYRGQQVPDGIYPFRYVSVLDSYDMDSVNGSIRINSSQSEVTDKVADWDKYANLENIMVVNGDSWYADLDWKSDKVTMFYPNPLRQSYGQFEITKVPAPGTVSIKIYNIAGDLVRDSGYECMNARGVTSTLEQINNSGGIDPDWTTNTGGSSDVIGGGNFALRCKWDRTNNNGRKVARGLYYAIMELSPTRGNAVKSQKVIKILIP